MLSRRTRNCTRITIDEEIHAIICYLASKVYTSNFSIPTKGSKSTSWRILLMWLRSLMHQHKYQNERSHCLDCIDLRYCLNWTNQLWQGYQLICSQKIHSGSLRREDYKLFSNIPLAVPVIRGTKLLLKPSWKQGNEQIQRSILSKLHNSKKK